ncbi:MAG: PspC domain-containing protein [Clostridia bacterium]|nr:PspC domain-containing protein [Clostridia bacterium]
MNKLYKSDSDKIFFGVLGGFAEKYNRDSTAVRIVYSLLTVFTAVIPGLILYVVLGCTLKVDPMRTTNYKEYLSNRNEDKKALK